MNCKACLLFWIFASCTSTAAEPELTGYTTSFPAMGSTYDLSVYAADETVVADIAAKIQAEVIRCNAIFSDYDPSSELERLLASKNPAQVELSEDLWNVLLESQSWFERSDGAFDPSVGRLTHLWRNARRGKKIPMSDEVTAALAHVGWSKIQLHTESRRIELHDPQVEIDFGGIATGYTIDRCFQILLDAGLQHCMIDSGGDIRCGDAPPGRDGWHISIAGVTPESEALQILTLSNCAVTTSGDLWRFIEVDGVRRSHIVDPRTGYGIEGPMSVTVIASTAIEVDVLGTTLSVMGPEKGLVWLEKNYPSVQAMFIRQSKADFQIRTTKFFGNTP